jgi:predicted RNase H-like nuclease (RuvC/YqgF family)
MRKAAGDMKAFSTISRIRIRENEMSVLKEKIQTLEKENEEQRIQGKKEEKLRAKAINEKLNLKGTVENLQMENHHRLEEIQLLTAEKVELFEAKNEASKLKKHVEELREEKKIKKAELCLVNEKSLALQKQIETLKRKNNDNQLHAKKETSKLKAQVKILAKENKENSKVPSALKVSGRVGSYSSIKGIYLRAGNHCGRVYYQKKQTADKCDWTIRWSDMSEQWEFDNGAFKYAMVRVADDVNHPLLISKAWTD